ncbi:uncharacterized protein TNCV_3865501 [Trichonephila clavipes]|nr:uncharacterized protein TNCV_3865501 [Trichonephila clavipes]
MFSLIDRVTAEIRERFQQLQNLAQKYAVLSDESRFQLRPEHHRRRVWRRPEQRADPAFIFACHTGPQPGVMVCPLSLFLSKMWARVAMNCLTACQALPWPGRSHSNRACLRYDGKAIASTREC